MDNWNSYYEKNYPTLGSQQGTSGNIPSSPDFSSLTPGTDYVSLFKNGEEQRILMSDLQKAGFTTDQRGYLGPPIRGGHNPTVPTYPVKRKLSPQPQPTNNFQGQSASNYPNSFNSQYSPSHSSSPYVPSFTPHPTYSNAAQSSPSSFRGRGGGARGNNEFANNNNYKGNNKGSKYQGGGDRQPNQNCPNNSQANSQQNNTSRPPYSNGPSSSQFNGLFNDVQKIRRTVDDEVHGIDALALRLGDVETDISHETGIKNTLKVMKDDITTLKSEKTVLSVDGDSASYLESHVESFQTKQEIHEFRLQVLAGIVDCQQKEIKSIKGSYNTALAAYLIDNVIVGGIRVFPNENCRDLAANFFTHRMNLPPRPEDILYAERMGQGITKGSITFPPLLKVRCSPFYRSVVWNKRQVLKGQKDPQFHWKFFIDLQRPDTDRAAQIRYREMMSEMIEENKGKEEKDHRNPKVK